MARPISSDIILVNREGTDYKTTYTDVNPTACDLPLLPGPPVIALDGGVQTAPAELGDTIDVFREGDGPSPFQYQWQRGLKQDWTDIPGATGTQYTFSFGDLSLNIRLQQTFSDGTELYSNEIVGTIPPPPPWTSFDVLFEITRLDSKTWTLSVPDGTKMFDRDSYEEINVNFSPNINQTVIYASSARSGFNFAAKCDYELGALTDTSKITSMSGLFYGSSAFVGKGVEYIDTSNVTNLSSMFFGCTKFNQDLNSLDVSSVTYLVSTFEGCTDFNGDVSSWDVSSVTDMNYTFRSASTFNQDIGNWDTSNAKSMRYTLSGASDFNQDLSSWCVTEIKTMPTGFSEGTNSWVLPKPIWGTCP